MKFSIHFKKEDSPWEFDKAGKSFVWSHDFKIWLKNGHQHREDDRPSAIESNGNVQWTKNGEMHRISGPAVITGTGIKFWFLDGINQKTEEIWKANRNMYRRK